MKILTRILFIALSFFAYIETLAESNVYIFYPEVLSATEGNSTRPEATICINGDTQMPVYGKCKRTFDANTSLRRPLYYYSGGVQKCIFNSEGKVVITYTFNHINGMNLTKTPFLVEIQLDLIDGETYYVEFSRKKAKLLPNKKGENKLKKADFVMPDWTEHTEE